MADYQDIEVKVFGSRREAATYDQEAERQIGDVIRDEVLPTMAAEYRSVRVKVKRAADRSPDHLVAYLLRKDTYTADVVRIDVDENYGVRNVVQSYDDSAEEEDEDDDTAAYADPETYAVDFIAATCETGIKSAVDAVNDLHQMATMAGLKSRKLLGAAANRANYKHYLKSGVKGFVNIGHGNTGCIVLHDGTLSAAWFNSLAGDPVDPAVVYFNSCQVFNPPLQPAVMSAGARTFIGGIVNLGIGTSERVCRCFWKRSLDTLQPMGANLTRCEREKYPTQGAHGISGDRGLFWTAKWHYALPVVRTHAKHTAESAWAIVGDSPWLRLRPNAPDGVTNTFMTLCEARANGRKVDVYVHDGRIEQSTMR